MGRWSTNQKGAASLGGRGNSCWLLVRLRDAGVSCRVTEEEGNAFFRTQTSVGHTHTLTQQILTSLGLDLDPSQCVWTRLWQSWNLLDIVP